MPVYEEKVLKNGQKKYFIRTYITLANGTKKQIKKRDKLWIGKDGYWLAVQEENRLKNKVIFNSKYMTFGDVVDKYLDDIKIKRKESTLYTYQNAIDNHIKQLYFYNKNIKEINMVDIKSFHDNFDFNYSTQYKNKIHNIMVGILDIAVNFYGVESNFERNLGRFQNKKEEVISDDEKIRYITYNDFKIILSKINDRELYVYFYFLYFTGMRKGESLALNWNDISFSKSIIFVNKTLTNKTNEGSYKITSTKNQQNRRIEIDKITLKYLAELYNCAKKRSNFDMNDFVFGDKKPLSSASLNRWWKSYFDDTDINYITIHELRHSHVSFLINEYINSGQTDTSKFFLICSNRMGHTINVMQKTYLHMFPSFQNSIVSIIDEMNGIF